MRTYLSGVIAPVATRMKDAPQFRPPLSALAADELHARAQQYRQMAATTRTVVTHDSLLRLADKYDALALSIDAAERDR